MAVSIACPSCRKKFRGRPELRGKKVRCPACEHAFVVEGFVPEAETEPAAAKKGPAKAPARGGPPGKTKPNGKTRPAPRAAAATDDDEDEYSHANPYGVTELDLAPRCPHCANEMESADAVICLFCGYNTETRDIGSTTTVYAITPGEHFKWLMPGLGNAFTIIFLAVFCFWFCIVLPTVVKPKSWWALLDHESMRMWFTLLALGGMWPLGFFAYRRLIMEPKPREKKKE